MIIMILSQRQRYLEYLKEQEKKNTPRCKHIYKRPNGFAVTKYINGENRFFRLCDTLDEAIDYRNRLIANDWKQLPLTEEELLEKNTKKYYKRIQKPSKGRKYHIYNKNNKYLGACPTIEESLYYRDLFYDTPLEEVKKPKDLDLTKNNKYITEGLKYPLPERLKFEETNYGKGSLFKKGNESYQIQYNGKHICNCRTYEQAHYIRQEMIKRNWDTNQLQEVLDSYPEYYTYLMEFYRYIQYRKDYKERGDEKYSITIPAKYLEEGKKLELINGYSNLEDALYERDFLVANNWNYDLLIDCIDDNQNPYYDMELPPFPERKIRNISERNYHEKELNIVRELILQDYTQSEIAKELGVTDVTIRLWLKNFWNSSFNEFKTITLAGDNPLEVLEKQKLIYQPDLSRSKPSNFKGYIHVNSRSSKRSPYQVIKDNIRYGQYPTKKMAKEVVKKLIACNWDKKQLQAIQKEVGYEPVTTRNFVYPYGKYAWQIRHRDKNKKTISFGVYKNYSLACLIRDELIQNKWNKTLLPKIKEDMEYLMRAISLVKSNMFYGNNNTLNYFIINYYEEIIDTHYLWVNGKYQVVNYNKEKGVMESYGTYDSEEKAQEIIEILKYNNWDEEVLSILNEI